MACQAGIVPIVLGGASEPLGVDRQRRFHAKAMRVAMGVRDGGCTTVGCLAHDPRYLQKPAPGGKITFTRRT